MCVLVSRCYDVLGLSRFNYSSVLWWNLFWCLSWFTICFWFFFCCWFLYCVWFFCCNLFFSVLILLVLNIFMFLFPSVYFLGIIFAAFVCVWSLLCLNISMCVSVEVLPCLPIFKWFTSSDIALFLPLNMLWNLLFYGEILLPILNILLIFWCYWFSCFYWFCWCFRYVISLIALCFPLFYFLCVSLGVL